MDFGYFSIDESDMVLGIPLGLFAWALFLPVVRALRERSFKRYFKGFFCSLIAVFFPLFIFLFSSVMVPEWKGESSFGWLGCMHTGKMVLLPLVLWGGASYCVARILRDSEKPVKGWALWGLFAGASVSGILFILEVVIQWGGDAHLEDLRSLRSSDWPFSWFGAIGGGWALVPLIVSIWYGVVFRREKAALGRSSKGTWWTSLSTAPFWGLAFWVCKNTYAALPDNPPTCFVVTAASKGPDWLVGPVVLQKRVGGMRRANRQLIRFWRLEALWQQQFPGGHARLRKVYNRVGPVVARRVRGPVLASVVYLALKPLEWVACLICRRSA